MGLVMIYRSECNLRSNLLAEILEHCTIEVLCIVDHDVLRDAVSIDDILLEIFLIDAEVTFMRGFTSTHFVKYSTAMTVKV
jgi:hypothetical protein